MIVDNILSYKLYDFSKKNTKKNQRFIYSNNFKNSLNYFDK